MKPNQKLLFSLLAGTSFMIAGCSDSDSDLPIENLTIVEEGNAAPAMKAESTQPTAILGSGGSMSEILSRTFTNIVDPSKAKHVVVACSDLDSYEDEIMAAYQRGIVITVVDPVGETLEGWCATKGMVYTGDPVATDGASLVSFNRKAASISMQRTIKPVAEEPIEEDEVPMVIFTGWLDKILSNTLHGIDYRSKDIKKRVAPQRVSHVFPIALSAEEVKAKGWGMPENISLYTTAELSCDIYPLHSFADNASFTGDFYAVEAELTIHNGNLYNGRWQYSQGDRRYESCGFYLPGCGLDVSLLERTPSGLTHSDMHEVSGGPAPVSTAFDSPCQTGFEWNFDGWISGGSGLESSTPVPLQEGGWTWSNLAESSPMGVDILSDPQGGNVSWRLSLDGLTDGREDAVPALASGDLTFRCSWIWGVPQAKDDTDGRYYMQVDLTPRYVWTRSLLPNGRPETSVIAPSVPSARLMLVPPSRKEGQRL